MKKIESSATIGVLAGIASALCVTGYFTINKYIYNNYDITAFQYSLLFAVMGGSLGLISLVTQSSKEIRKDLWLHYKLLIILSVAGFLAVGLFVFGQQYTTSINAALLTTSTIVTTAVFSYAMLREKLDKSQWLWIAVMFTGLYIGIVGFNSIHLLKGDVIVLCAAVVFGFGNVLSRIIMKKVKKPAIVPDARLTIAGFIALVLMLLFVHEYNLKLSVLPLALTAGFFFWLCMKFFAKAVHLLNANEAIVLNNSQIFFTSILGVAVLSEPYSLEKFMGSVIVMISIYFIAIHGKRTSKQKQ